MANNSVALNGLSLNLFGRAFNATRPIVYEDGLTILRMLAELQKWINENLVDHLNKEITELIEAIDLYKVEIEAAMNALDESVNDRLELNEARMQEAIETVINSSIQLQDAVMAGIVTNLTSATSEQLNKLYSRKFEIDVRDYGWINSTTADNTKALQDALNDGGAACRVQTPFGIYTVNGTIILPDGAQVVGAGMRSTVFRSEADVTMFRSVGGQAQTLRDFTIQHWQNGPRTSYDISFINPTRPTLSNIEVVGSSTSSGAGGISFRKDSAQPGSNAFMPVLDRVWIRDGHLIIDGVTDGKVSNSYVWGPGRGTSTAAIHMSNISNSWTFTGVDVIPTQGDTGNGYYIHRTWNTEIVGGYIDGSYPDNMTGHGITVVDGGQLVVSGYNVYNVGRSAFRIVNSVGCVVGNTVISGANKTGLGYPDIDLVNSRNNTFINTNHKQAKDNAVKGAIFREDSASSHNKIDYTTLDISQGNFYAPQLISANPGTQGKNCRPVALFPRPAGVALTIPVTRGVGSVTPWPANGRIILSRFTIPDGAVYRYAAARIEAGVGNMAAAIYSVDASGNLKKVSFSPGVAINGTTNAIFDLSSLYYAPGDYALAIWADSTTITTAMNSGNNMALSRTCAEITNAGGLPETSVIASWNGTRELTPVSLYA
ncbi:pre-neck appendage protein [Microbacterium phage Curie]